jgi:hypothetical protein
MIKYIKKSKVLVLGIFMFIFGFNANAQVVFYNFSCDLSTSAFSDVSQAFTATNSGCITRVAAGIGLFGTGATYGTTITVNGVPTNYGNLNYSGRCCYSSCAPGNNMSTVDLPYPVYVKTGDNVVISFTGSAGEKHYQGGQLRMYVTGVNGSSLNFDGVNDFVNVPHNTVLNVTKASISAWIYREDDGQQIMYMGGKSLEQLELHTLPNSSVRFIPTSGVYLDAPVNSLPINVWTNVACVYDPSIGLAKIYINGNEVSIVNSGPNTLNQPMFGSTSNYNLGRRNDNTFYFKGNLDEFRLWNKVLTQSEILSNLNCEISAQSGLVAYYDFNQGSPNANNTGSTTLIDLSGNNLNGTLNNFALNGTSSNWVKNAIGQEIDVLGNGVSITNGDNTPSVTDFTDFGTTPIGTPITRTFTISNTGSGNLKIKLPLTITGANASNFTITTQPSATIINGGSSNFTISFNPSSVGVKNAVLNLTSNDCDEENFTFSIQGTGPIPASALSFDGANDYVSVPGINLANKSYSIECWVKRNLNNEYAFVASQGNMNDNNGLHFGYRNTNEFTFAFWGNDLNSPQYPDTDWIHWAGTFDAVSKERKIYRNGNLVGSDIASSNFLGTGNFIIGATAWFNGFSNIHLDEFRVWDKVLCQSEIQSRMNCEIQGAMPNLLINYHFNQGFIGVNNSTVTTLIDASGNNNNGTLTNFALNGTASNWISPSPITTGTTCGVFKPALAAVLSNNITIASGTTTTSVGNNTFMGTAAINTPFERTFTIKNTGTANLTITSGNISGTHVADFSLVSFAPPVLTPNQSHSFKVRFNPLSTTGIRNAIVNIFSNACNAGTYTFAVSGESMPAITATRAGAANSDVIVSVTSFGSENTAVGAGYFQNTINLGGSLTSSGDKDIVVVRTNAAGAVTWSRRFGGSGNDQATSVHAVNSSLLVVTGFFSGTVTFGSTTLVSKGAEDIFVTALDYATGNVVWAKSFGSIGPDRGMGIATDGTNIILTGHFSQSIAFDAVGLSSLGVSDGFVAKLSNTGTVLWAKSMNGAANVVGLKTAIDASGNVFVSGKFSGSATFGVTNLSATGKNDAFVTGLTTAGDFSWAVRLGTGSEDDINSIAVDGSSVYVGLNNSYMALNKGTGATTWTKTISGKGKINAVLKSAISGNLIVLGSYSDEVDLDGAKTYNTNGGFDYYITEVNPSTGAYIKSVKYGNIGTDVCYGIAESSASVHTVYVGGVFNTTDHFTATPTNESGNGDLFIGKFNW